MRVIELKTVSAGSSRTNSDASAVEPAPTTTISEPPLARRPSAPRNASQSDFPISYTTDLERRASVAFDPPPQYQRHYNPPVAPIPAAHLFPAYVSSNSIPSTALEPTSLMPRNDALSAANLATLPTMESPSPFEDPHGEDDDDAVSDISDAGRRNTAPVRDMDADSIVSAVSPTAESIPINVGHAS